MKMNMRKCDIRIFKVSMYNIYIYKLNSYIFKYLLRINIRYYTNNKSMFMYCLIKVNYKNCYLA